MIYGHSDTIHQTKYLDIVMDESGIVQGVWFRCMMLPFKVSVREQNQDVPEVTHKLIAIEFED